MKRVVRLYAVAIRAGQKAGDWRETVLFYREAELVDPGPSAATATCVFLACYEAKQVQCSYLAGAGCLAADCLTD